MGMLDWINNRHRPDASIASGFDPKAHGHKDWKGVFAEIRHDEALARVRNETGCEPPSATIEPQRNSRESDVPLTSSNTSDAKVQQKKQSSSWER